MQDGFSQIQFITANYSRLQGLRAVPVGVLAVFASIWALHNQGPTADLGVPILVALAVALLYVLTDRYYRHTFGQIKRTGRQRTIEAVGSVFFGVLGFVAFVVDTAEVVPVSCIGIVFSLSFLEYFSRTAPSEWGKIVNRFPENIVAAILMFVISLLPLFGVSWWTALGIRSQVVGVLMIVGIVIILTGIWGHIRLVRALSSMETNKVR